MVILTYGTTYISTKRLINAWKIEIMGTRKIAQVVSIVVILEAYSAYNTFLFHSWRPISSFKIGDDKVDLKIDKYPCLALRDK